MEVVVNEFVLDSSELIQFLVVRAIFIWCDHHIVMGIWIIYICCVQDLACRFVNFLWIWATWFSNSIFSPTLWFIHSNEKWKLFFHFFKFLILLGFSYIFPLYFGPWWKSLKFGKIPKFRKMWKLHRKYSETIWTGSEKGVSNTCNQLN